MGRAIFGFHLFGGTPWVMWFTEAGQMGSGGAHLYLRLALPLEKPRHLLAGPVKLWIAQGFGIGRIPVAPGTFGSLVGVLWFGLLLMTGSFWLFAAGTLAGDCALRLALWRGGKAAWANGPGLRGAR